MLTEWEIFISSFLYLLFLLSYCRSRPKTLISLYDDLELTVPASLLAQATPETKKKAAAATSSIEQAAEMTSALVNTGSSATEQTGKADNKASEPAAEKTQTENNSST